MNTRGDAVDRILALIDAGLLEHPGQQSLDDAPRSFVITRPDSYRVYLDGVLISSLPAVLLLEETPG